MALKLLQAVFIFHFLCTGGFVTSVVVKSQSNYLETQSNNTIEVNALVAVLPPFTHFDSNRGFVEGIDILILETISKRLNFRLNFTKVQSIGQISKDRLK